MIGFIDAIKMFFRRYVDFQGRSSRAEYWWVQLFIICVVIVLAIPIGVSGGFDGTGTLGPLASIFLFLLGIFVLAIIIPNIALFVRRLHDINQTGWIYLGLLIAGLIPVIGLLSTIAQIVIACIQGTKGPNKYGDDPYGSTAEIFD